MFDSYWLLVAIVAAVVLLVILVLTADASPSLTLHNWIRGNSWTSFFDGKVVWVTGCSSGIGEQIVYHLAKHNARIIISARRTDELERVRNTCFELNSNLGASNVKILAFDLCDHSSYKSHVETAIRFFGRVDVLINNAGRSQRDADWINTNYEVDVDCFKLNTLAPVSLSRHLLPHMLENSRGWIAVVSSIAGVIGVERSNSYCAAKHALQGYFKCLDLEYSSKGITVSIVCPGLVYSPNNINNAFTGSPDEKYGKSYNKTFFHMNPSRCAELILISTAYGIHESWVAHPLGLIATYSRLYFPVVMKLVMRFGGARVFHKLRGAPSE